MSTEQRPQEGALTPPLNPHLAAVWGAFLHEGLMLNGKCGKRSTAILELWGHGCIELIMACCEFVPLVWKQVQPYWHGPQGFPGVFEYEVLSILGEQLGSYMLNHDGNVPSSSEADQMIAELVVTFFSNGGTIAPNLEQEPQTDRLINLHHRFTDRLGQLAGGAS